jgi:hypothetical protein
MKKLSKERLDEIQREAEASPSVVELRRLVAKAQAELAAKRAAEEHES